MSSYPHHDRFVRGSLADIGFSRRFFRLLLEKRVLKAIDLDKLELRKDSFIDKNLNAIFTDLLFTAPYSEKEACITLLMEHKSEGTVLAPGCDLPWQLRCQEIEVMKDFRRNHPQNQAPVVWLIGLYHGSNPYEGPLTVAENMYGPKRLIPRAGRNRICSSSICAPSVMRNWPLVANWAFSYSSSSISTTKTPWSGCHSCFPRCRSWM